MITAEDLTIRAGRSTLIDRVSLALKPGAVTAIVGPNGAGKSTLVRALTGELAPASGRVAIDGEDLAHWTPRALAARRAVLPQASSLAFPFTVHEVVRLGVLAARDRRAANDRVVAALSAVDLSGFGGRLYQQLSGGEQQRVHLARVLCQLPAAWLFLDEPTSSLDLRHQLMALVAAQRFARAGGGVVAVLHDLNLAARHADRIVVICKGRVAANGAPADVLTPQMIEEVFGVALAVGRTGDGTPYVLPHGIAAAS